MSGELGVDDSSTLSTMSTERGAVCCVRSSDGVEDGDAVGASAIKRAARCPLQVKIPVSGQASRVDYWKREIPDRHVAKLFHKTVHGDISAVDDDCLDCAGRLVGWWRLALAAGFTRSRSFLHFVVFLARG